LENLLAEKATVISKIKGKFIHIGTVVYRHFSRTISRSTNLKLWNIYYKPKELNMGIKWQNNKNTSCKNKDIKPLDGYSRLETNTYHRYTLGTWSIS